MLGFLSNIPFGREIMVGVAVAALCLPLGYCQGKSAGEDKMRAAAAVATVEAIKVDGDAKEVAALERAKSVADIKEKQDALIEAVADYPDATPSPRRVALACQRLQNDGYDVSTLPACSGPRATGEAKAGGS